MKVVSGLDTLDLTNGRRANGSAKFEHPAAVPMFYPDISEAQRQAVEEVLQTRWIGQGPKVDELEAMCEEHFGRPCVAVNSGTSALHLAMILAGVKEHDRVLTTPLTCTATNMAILFQRAHPVFCDIETSSMCMDPEDVQIRGRSFHASAVVAVHLNGEACDMAALSRLKLPVIEDAAQALGGAHRDGTPIGTSGDFVCFSFQAIKHLTTGDGGLLVCADRKDAARARKLRWFGIDRRHKREMGWKSFRYGRLIFDIEELGYKYQMHDMAATMALAGWPRLDESLGRRRAIVGRYRENLRGVRFFENHPGSACWGFPILVDRRDDFVDALERRGVETSLVQVRNDLYRVFGGRRLELPHLNRIEARYVYIPCHPLLTDEQVSRVINAVNQGW